MYKPIINFLEVRRKKIEEGLAKAEKFEEEWQKIKDIQKEMMSQTEKESVLLIEKARSDAEKKEKEILNLARQKSEKIAEETRRDILLEKDKILGELKKEVADYIVFAAEKILKRSLGEKDEKNIIKETLEALRKNEK